MYMSRTISRRQALATGAVATGAMIGSGCSQSNEQQTQTPSATSQSPANYWNPGPDKSLVKDLTPGSTPIRLGGYIRRSDSKSITEVVKDLHDLGLRGAIATADDWHDAEDSVVREFIEAQNKYDVVIFEVGGYRNILHPDEAKRKEFIERLAFSLEAAERIGCQMVGTVSGSMSDIGVEYVDNYNVNPDNWTIEAWNRLTDSLKEVLRLTSGLKAGLGIEAQVTTNIDGPKAHRRLIDEMGDPRISVNLDPTNMCHFYNYYHTTELINECFDTLGEDIHGCHAKDTFIFPHQQTVHVQEVCPGRGVLDYETYLVRLSRMKWSRTLLPEHIPADQFDEAYAYLRKVADRVGVTFLS